MDFDTVLLGRWPYNLVDHRFVVPRGKRSLPSGKRALLFAILELSHTFYAGNVCHLWTFLAGWIFPICGGQGDLCNTCPWSIRYTCEWVRIPPHSFVQCVLFNRFGLELHQRVQFIPSELRSGSAAAVTCEDVSGHCKVSVPVSAVVSCIRLGGEESVFSVRSSQRNVYWECDWTRICPVSTLSTDISYPDVSNKSQRTQSQS